MSLDEIIEKTDNGERVIVDWFSLKNVYFRGDNSLKQMEDWAKKHSIKFLKSDVISEGYNSIEFKTVMFLPKNK